MNRLTLLVFILLVGTGVLAQESVHRDSVRHSIRTRQRARLVQKDTIPARYPVAEIKEK